MLSTLTGKGVNLPWMRDRQGLNACLEGLFYLGYKASRGEWAFLQQAEAQSLAATSGNCLRSASN